MLSKDYKIGRTFEEIEVGSSLQITENIEDKDLLLYLGLTNDNNPLYIQHEFAALTAYERPIVPTIMLSGILTSAVSKYLPGPGSYITALSLTYPNALHHYETLHMSLKVIKKIADTHELVIEVDGKNDEGVNILVGEINVVPPKKIDTAVK
ncbi:MAG: hypothetical protein KBT36_06785 [Kurthia sp.]|nr:hypothetical protein [Candidatus Kurthia equi]